MKRPIDTAIDPAACTGCGECVRVCPMRSIAMRGDTAAVTGPWSIGCGHCAAVCPAGAVTVGGIGRGGLPLSTVIDDGRHVAPGDYDLPGLIGLMRSRRSCRNYLDRPVPREVLEDLVTIGTTAPSGTNFQLWTFTALQGRPAVLEFGGEVAEFFRGLNRKSENPLWRLLAKLFMGDALNAYRRDYYEEVKEGLRSWDRERRDLLFHGAPAVLFIGSNPGGTCPAEDALMASQNILLAAHAMGLGTCMIGFAVEAIRYDRRLADVLGIPRRENVHAAIALGYPDESYREPAGRRPVSPRYFTGSAVDTAP